MRLIRIMQEVYCRPWLVTPEMHGTISRIVLAHVDGSAHADGGCAVVFDADAEDGPRAPYIDDGVAVIPVEGVLAPGVSEIEKSSGMADTDDIAAAIEMAADDPQVSALVLDIDSPGGAVSGIPELAALVAEVRAEKPVVAFARGQCCSAAYWIASQASAVYASQSAEVGSIGAYMALMDSSRAHEMAGLRREVFASGKFKAAGLPGTSLTAEQRANFQAAIDEIAGEFKRSVLDHRGGIPAEAMEGQTFWGASALGVGLVDSTATLAKAVNDARSLSGR